MDRKRAEQIMESMGVINVQYEGHLVWLEAIKKDKAEITYMDTHELQEVPLQSLKEEISTL